MTTNKGNSLKLQTQTKKSNIDNILGVHAQAYERGVDGEGNVARGATCHIPSTSTDNELNLDLLKAIICHYLFEFHVQIE